ncbi:MAG: nucleotidyltransferase family protein [Deltaproteobacteria bacterium]|nr:nucleotidyltransferase family protein [Myxococcales bacterium]MDP3220809.1 nucleotidyltransferase family protein [Deltaproteobacteria bacterium]
MATRLDAGKVQAMVLHRQRAMLREVAREVGADLLFLKAAWADPVLYGGRGDRVGSDLDALVSPGRFEAFAAALEQRGFRRHEPPRHRATNEWGSKEWSYGHPGAWMPVDLHRGLATPPWFDLDAARVFARARDWRAGDEVIRSLGAEDQLLYAAVHYANHLYTIDGRHAGDVLRLLEREALDWALVFREAERGGMRLVLQLLLEHLRARGAEVPAAPWEGEASMRARRRLIGRWIEAGATLGRRRPMGRRLGVLLERPVLSDRWGGLPVWAARYAALRALDRVLR